MAIIGSGPAGLAAGARAAARGITHVVLERSTHLADTIVQYQKGKHVMATPDELPVSSEVPFAESTREVVLDAFAEIVQRLGVYVRFGADVVGIDGARGDFVIRLRSGETVHAETVVLAIGTQGNVNRVTAPGAELAMIQYGLADPRAYADEDIVVLGAGDSAIENALALAEQNDVTIVNRSGEFARAKTGNHRAIREAVDLGDLSCVYHAQVARFEPGLVVLRTPDGESVVRAHRIIARIGSQPPRRFLNEIGVEIRSDDPAAVPDVSATYESNRPGLYIVGALAGYPLIKQCLNQGADVVDHILGLPVVPADEPLLAARFAATPGTVSEVAARIHAAVPLFGPLSALQLREALLDSTLHAPPPGSVVFARSDYTDTLYSIVDGSVDVLVDPNDDSRRITLGKGDFFGEGSLLSGRRRSATVVAGEGALLLETPRRTILKLSSSIRSIRRVLDEAAMIRTLQSALLGPLGPEDRVRLQSLVHDVPIRRFDAGDVLFRQGDVGDGLYVIRKGSVTISRATDAGEVVLAYEPAGKYIGEMALLNDAPRNATVRANVVTETIFLPKDAWNAMLALAPGLRARVEEVARRRLVQSAGRETSVVGSDLVKFLVGQGIGEATDVLLIDESLCVACNNCEKACAATHGGTSRLDREAGPSYAHIHVPTSCRHCEDPKCMTECPPDAIHRHGSGEVYIDDSCIGCGNCEANCPYGVIQMAAVDARGAPTALEVLFPWLTRILRGDPGPREVRKTAVKCDMCRDQAGGPACVASCPTGAAMRVSPTEWFALRRTAR